MFPASHPPRVGGCSAVWSVRGVHTRSQGRDRKAARDRAQGPAGRSPVLSHPPPKCAYARDTPSWCAPRDHSISRWQNLMESEIVVAASVGGLFVFSDGETSTQTAIMTRNEWDEVAAAAGERADPAPRGVSRRVAGVDRAAAQQKHQESLRSVAQSLQLARETAHTLSMQSEQLGRNERAVEEAQYAVDLSKRIMRGMTWSGWIANAFTAAPQVDRKSDTAPAGSSGASDTQITMGFICPECKVMFKNPEELAMHYAKAHEVAEDSREGSVSGRISRQTRQPPQQQAKSSVEDVHEQFLRDLEPQLAELKEASLALGNAIDTQNRQLDRLDDKIDTVHDGMKRVSVQAKKLTGRKLPVTFRFRCAFQEVETRRFLRDVEGEAVLGADILVDGCTFRAYTLGDDTEIWGFQSEVSSNFLGLNRYGNLKIRGADLQSYEQFAIESSQPSTALFAFASYFGYGGWVTRKDEEKLSIIRGTPENKHAAARFKMINLDQIQSELKATP